MDSQYNERQTAVITRQRAQITALQDEKKRLEVLLAIERGEAITYSDFIKYSGHTAF